MNPLSDVTGRRIIAFLAVAVALFALLSYRLMDLQIAHGVEFRERSDNNRIRLIEIEAPRGVIRDRHGRLIVSNTPSYSCYGVPHELWREPMGISILENVLNTPDGVLKNEILSPIRRSFRPHRMQRDLSFATLSAFEEQRDRIPGAFLEIEPKRFHPDGLCAHLIGYIGEISPRELEQFPEMRKGDLIGKRGLERLYDSHLRGRRGKGFSVVNVHGQEIDDPIRQENIDPISGNELWLTIDSDAQMLAESLLTGKIGAIVAMEIGTGAVLALASSPTYDPDLFAGAIDADAWRGLLSDEQKPMLNRTVQTMYPPGSTVKMTMLVQGLASGVIDSNWTVHCPGYHKVGNHKFRCWRRGGHGRVDCYRAIEASCDVFFYRLGLKLGADGIHDALDRFHFGRATGIDQTSEAAGLIPSTEYYDRRYGKRGWTKGYLPSIAIGQGEVLVTPLQMCAFIAALGDGEFWRRPYIVERIVNPTTGTEITPDRAAPVTLDIPDHILKIAREGVRRVVWGDRGTARAQRDELVPIGGKTGTAQNSHGEDHAWFVGYAPVDSPRYAVCALVEFGEHGSSAAAPLVKQILTQLVTSDLPMIPSLAANAPGN